MKLYCHLVVGICQYTHLFDEAPVLTNRGRGLKPWLESETLVHNFEFLAFSGYGKVRFEADY